MLLKAILTIVGIIIVIFIMSIFGLSDIVRNILSANVNYVFLAFIVQILALLMMAQKLKCVSNAYSKLSFAEVFKIWIVGNLVNLATPFVQFGGEPVKIYLFKKHGLSTTHSSAIIAIDDLSEFATMFIMLLISAVLLLLTSELPMSLTIAFFAGLIISTVLIAVFFFVCLNKRILESLIAKMISIANHFGITHRRSPSHYATLFYNSFKFLLKNTKLLAKIFILSFFAKFMDFIRLWLIFLALGFLIPFDVVIYVWAVILLIRMLPSLPGGLGLVEAGGTAAFILFGISQSLSASAVILDRFISFWFVFLLGIVVASLKFR